MAKKSVCISCSIIRRTVAENISCELKSCSMHLKGFCGDQCWLNNLIRAELKFDNLSLDTVFYVAEDHLLDEDVLIKQNIFDNENVRCVIEDGQIKLLLIKS